MVWQYNTVNFRLSGLVIKILRTLQVNVSYEPCTQVLQTEKQFATKIGTSKDINQVLFQKLKNIFDNFILDNAFHIHPLSY